MRSTQEGAGSSRQRCWEAGQLGTAMEDTRALASTVLGISLQDERSLAEKAQGRTGVIGGNVGMPWGRQQEKEASRGHEPPIAAAPETQIVLAHSAPTQLVIGCARRAPTSGPLHLLPLPGPLPKQAQPRFRQVFIHMLSSPVGLP